MFEIAAEINFSEILKESIYGNVYSGESRYCFLYFSGSGSPP